jgi:acyl-homoserine-lactone acylase
MRMTRSLLLVAAFPLSVLNAQQRADLTRWERQARAVTITRDDWGIAHIHGRTDADAVFGMIYAQAEDDFNRVETNYLDALGWLAQAEGDGQVWHDLRARLYADPDTLKAMYRGSPAWLKSLMNAFADGLNYYLYKHPDVHSRVITRFEPWMALAFSEGSIGPDIETIALGPLQQFYGVVVVPGAPATERPRPVEPGGSNGMAVAPSRTSTGHALFLINPHTSFFFRSELQMTSDQGLNAYGAVTWGQFFIYQGFNERLGWMHTSSGVDAIDEFRETIVMRDGQPFYRVGGAERPVARRSISISFRTADGVRTRPFTVYGTRHGPIVRQDGEHWVSVGIMHRPVQALIESFTRTKARTLAAFRRSLDMQANSSNNTVYADADGNIAYWQANFIPRRDTGLDWRQSVDGAPPGAQWHGMLPVDSIPQAVNPASGWLYNSNDAPWEAAGPSSPRKGDYPRYVENGGSSARGRHAVRVLQRSSGWTLDSLLAAAYDPYLTWFEEPVPALVRAWDQLPESDSLKARLRDQVDLLRRWDLHWGVSSVPTTLAIFWGENISRRVARAARGTGMLAEEFIAQRASGPDMLQALAAASDSIAARFGSWRTPWGDVNRFQRLTDDIVHPFSDAGPSIPVGFTGGQWGSLAAFASRAYPGTRKRYGTSGNSFVAVVEFGPDSVRARAVTAGGESGDVHSPHFNDQAERYVAGNLRDVYFYRSQLRGHTEREYHPGQ